MSPRDTIDVSAVIERQRLSRFLVGLVLMSWIITFFDGFDGNLISFAAPYFGSQYHLSRIQLGNLFSVGLFGTLIGGFILGYVGDRVGRRPSVIVATAGFGVCTLLFALANSYRSLFLLRLANGIPLGGMLPLAWALNIEYVPKRYRATIVTLIMMGYSLGTAVGGPAATWLIPKMGWQAVFILGGAVSLAAAAVLFLMLPESIRFLASKGGGRERIRAILRRLAPDMPVPAQAAFVVTDEAARGAGFRPGLLFRGELRWITPLIWVAYIFSSMAVFFIVNWTPLVFEALQFTKAQAATAASMNSAMGASRPRRQRGGRLPGSGSAPCGAELGDGSGRRAAADAIHGQTRRDRHHRHARHYLCSASDSGHDHPRPSSVFGAQCADRRLPDRRPFRAA
jgi:AAHS family 4-hydroxybenzoate transporter-like MFS transporter